MSYGVQWKHPSQNGHCFDEFLEYGIAIDFILEKQKQGFEVGLFELEEIDHPEEHNLPRKKTDLTDLLVIPISTKE
jgi:hypothetical protein